MLYMYSNDRMKCEGLSFQHSCTLYKCTFFGEACSYYGGGGQKDIRLKKTTDFKIVRKSQHCDIYLQ